MSTTPASNDFLEELTTLSRKIRTTFDRQVTARGLTYSRARLLFRLSQKQSVSQTELAAALELEQATVVRLLDRMEAGGLVSRQPHGGDRRTKLIVLTSFGEEQAQVVQALVDQLRKQAVENIDLRDVRIALELMRRVSENVERWEQSVVPA
jgi:MarR family transcriptional regulator for hemolysin